MSAAIGLLLIVRMPLNLPVRLLLVVAWLAWSGYELRSISRAWQSVRRIRLDILGNIQVEDRRGRMSPVALLPGSVVLARIAWLRLELPGGAKFGELLTENAVKSVEWHRLQLIWRQCRHILGGTGED